MTTCPALNRFALMETDRSATELEVATTALREAARLCQAVQQSLDYGVMEKGDRSPVTVADFGSQALICCALREAFPRDAIVAEEDAAALGGSRQEAIAAEVIRRVLFERPSHSPTDVLQWIDYGNGQPGRDRFWTLDPIDGTKGFLRGRQYAIALALVEDGCLRVGALACPNLDGGLLLTAASGQGSRCQSLGGDARPLAIQVSTTHEVSKARFCESAESGHSSHTEAHRLAKYLGISSNSVRLDSQAKYAVVARGLADIYLRLPTRRDYQERIWDHAAGALILAEAGGTVTDMHGHALDFSSGRTLARNNGVVATNGLLHAQVVEAISELGIGQGKA